MKGFLRTSVFGQVFLIFRILRSLLIRFRHRYTRQPKNRGIKRKSATFIKEFSTIAPSSPKNLIVKSRQINKYRQTDPKSPEAKKVLATLKPVPLLRQIRQRITETTKEMSKAKMIQVTKKEQLINMLKQPSIPVRIKIDNTSLGIETKREIATKRKPSNTVATCSSSCTESPFFSTKLVPYFFTVYNVFFFDLIGL